MNFINLTNNKMNDRDDVTEMFVNMERVTSMHIFQGKTWIFFDRDYFARVKETPEQIMAKC